MLGSVAQFGRAVSVCKGREPWFSVPCPVEKLQVVRPSAGPRTRRSNPSTPIYGLATPLTATKTCSVVPSVLGARRKTAPLLFKHVNRNTGDSLEAVGTRNRWTKPTELRKGISLPNSRSPNRVEAGGSLRVFAEESTFFQAAKTTSRGLN